LKKIIIRSGWIGIEEHDNYGTDNGFEFWLNRQLEYHNIDVEKYANFLIDLIECDIWTIDNDETRKEFLDKILNNPEIKKDFRKRKLKKINVTILL